MLGVFVDHGSEGHLHAVRPLISPFQKASQDTSGDELPNDPAKIDVGGQIRS